MSLAVVAPPWFEIPPEGHGGIEDMVATLVSGLDARGHTVTLVAQAVIGSKHASYRSGPTVVTALYAGDVERPGHPDPVDR